MKSKNAPSETHITANIPIRATYGGNLSLEEQKKNTSDDLRLKAMTLFEHLGLLTDLYECSQISAVDLVGITRTVADVGCALLEGIELSEMQYDRKIRERDGIKPRNPYNEPLDLTGFKQISWKD